MVCYNALLLLEGLGGPQENFLNLRSSEVVSGAVLEQNSRRVEKTH